jgi:myo-inositol catabolism protein IolC
MELGYDGKLYILAFDHRGSFQKKMFGIEGDPTDEQTEQIADAKHLIFEGLLKASEQGAKPEVTGCLVDEQFGSPKRVPEQAKERGLILAMPVEKSGQDEFDFDYGEEFGEHIEHFDPDFSKVLVRFNPDGDKAMNERQTERLRRLSEWLHEHDRKFLFELLVPAEPAQLEAVGGDTDRFDAELRPDLMIKTIEEFQDIGVEADVWKIEGIERKEDCQRVVEAARRAGRDRVGCIVLGRGEDDEKVRQWLRTAAGVPGFIGFAVGRTTFWNPLVDYRAGRLTRAAAVAQIAASYRGWVDLFEQAR